ncbi:MAG: SDR family NAD(P)-dependent oxidoreductase [Casimicrobiaceae bacterium]
MRDTLLRALSLKGKVALVTGAGRGIGRAIAERLGDADATVFVTDVNEGLLQETVGALRQNGVKAQGQVIDGRRSGAGEQTVRATLDAFGRIDVLVNNAAVFLPAPVLEVSEAEWDQMVDLNLKGMFFHAQAAAKAMASAGGGGRIINLASVAAHRPNELLSVYAATKGGVISATRALAKELGDRQINVNAVLPGVIDTPGAAIAIGKIIEIVPGALQSAKPPFVLGRTGSPQDIADAVLFLASDLAAYITGATLAVDGGYLL